MWHDRIKIDMSDNKYGYKKVLLGLIENNMLVEIFLNLTVIISPDFSDMVLFLHFCCCANLCPSDKPL